jgi:hydroxyethylthiazole kinase
MAAEEITAEAAGALLARVKERRPLVQNITNFVAMDLAANALLAVGAAPAMAHAAVEVEDFVARADALTVNTGTMDEDWAEAARIAARAAKANGKPWALDPVGAGATPFRRKTPMSLLEIGPTVLRGNASEILVMAGGDGGRGVDASDSVASSEAAARRLAGEKTLVVAVTGETDFVTDGNRALRLSGGHALMPRVTAVGCALTALTGAFLAVEDDALLASASALALMKLAGGRAGARAEGPGSFRVHLLDALYNITPEELASEAAIHAA